MFIFIFFSVLALSQYVSNKIMGMTAENEDSYTFSMKDSIILSIFFLTSIILQIISSVIQLNNTLWLTFVGVYALSTLIAMLIITNTRKLRIEKQREEMEQVYLILQPMVDKKNKGLDFNNKPFQLSYKYGNINKIKVEVDPTSFNDKSFAIILEQLNNFFPTFTWNYELYLDERYMLFIGYDKPPNLAKWKGSWLQHYRYFPLGVGGQGELAWISDKVPKNQLSESQYLDEHGNAIPLDLSLPVSPQVLAAGSTGSGKSIYINQEINN